MIADGKSWIICEEENMNDCNDSVIVQSWTFENDATLEWARSL